MKGHVLWVENDNEYTELIRDYITHDLCQSDIELVIKKNIDDAIDWIDNQVEHSIMAIVLDIMLPRNETSQKEIEGLEAERTRNLRTLREERKKAQPDQKKMKNLISSIDSLNESIDKEIDIEGAITLLTKIKDKIHWPVIFHSARDNPDLKHKAKQAVGNDYSISWVPKPASRVRLCNEINSAISTQGEP